MRTKYTGGKRDGIALNAKNADTAVISRGMPVVLALSGTNDGYGVVLQSSATTQRYGGLFGVALNDIAVGGTGEVQAYGFNSYSIIRRQTRAASTDSWASEASAAVGVVLAQDTVNNCFSTAAASQAASGFLPFAILASSVASYASSASATSDTRTAITQTCKTFLRIM